MADGRRDLQFFQGLRADDGRLGVVLVIGRAADEAHAEGAHEAGNGRTDDLAAQELFESPQDGVVVESAALDDDVLAELGRVFDLDDFIQGILDDRVREACRDVGQCSPFFLGLLDFGVHEDRAARAQVDGALGQEGGLREVLDGHFQGFGEGIQEGTAARRAGFIEQDVFDMAVFDAAAFHVLAADIKEEVDVRAEVGRCLIVGNGFDFAQVEVQRFLEQGFAVAGDAGFGDEGLFRQAAVDFGDDVLGRCQRAAFIVLVVRIKDLHVFAEDDGLDGRRAGVDAQVARAAVGGDVRLRDRVLAVAGPKFVEFGLVVEQRFDAVRFGQGRFVDVLQLAHEVHEGNGLRIYAAQGGADGHVDLSVFRGNNLFRRQMEGLGELFSKLGQVGQRTAEEADRAFDGTAAGQAGDGLEDDGLEDGSGDIFLAGPFVEQGLDVRLGEDAAAGGDGINRVGFLGQFIEAAGIGVEEGRHLVDEGPGPAGTVAVHAVFVAAGQVGDLRIFTAEFDDDVRLGIISADGFGTGNDFLQKGNVQVVCQGDAARAGDGHGDLTVAKDFIGVLE